MPYDGVDIIDTSARDKADVERAQRIAEESSKRSTFASFFKDRIKQNYLRNADGFLSTTKDKINQYVDQIKKPTINHAVDPKLIWLGVAALALWAINKLFK